MESIPTLTLSHGEHMVEKILTSTFGRQSIQSVNIIYNSNSDTHAGSTLQPQSLGLSNTQHKPTRYTFHPQKPSVTAPGKQSSSQQHHTLGGKENDEPIGFQERETHRPIRYRISVRKEPVLDDLQTTGSTPRHQTRVGQTPSRGDIEHSRRQTSLEAPVREDGAISNTAKPKRPIRYTFSVYKLPGEQTARVTPSAETNHMQDRQSAQNEVQQSQHMSTTNTQQTTSKANTGNNKQSQITQAQRPTRFTFRRSGTHTTSDNDGSHNHHSGKKQYAATPQMASRLSRSRPQLAPAEQQTHQASSAKSRDDLPPGYSSPQLHRAKHPVKSRTPNPGHRYGRSSSIHGMPKDDEPQAPRFYFRPKQVASPITLLARFQQQQQQHQHDHPNTCASIRHSECHNSPHGSRAHNVRDLPRLPPPVTPIKAIRGRLDIDKEQTPARSSAPVASKRKEYSSIVSQLPIDPEDVSQHPFLPQSSPSQTSPAFSRLCPGGLRALPQSSGASTPLRHLALSTTKSPLAGTAGLGDDPESLRRRRQWLVMSERKKRALQREGIMFDMKTSQYYQTNKPTTLGGSPGDESHEREPFAGQHCHNHHDADAPHESNLEGTVNAIHDEKAFADGSEGLPARQQSIGEAGPLPAAPIQETPTTPKPSTPSVKSILTGSSTEQYEQWHSYHSAPRTPTPAQTIRRSFRRSVGVLRELYSIHVASPKSCSSCPYTTTQRDVATSRSVTRLSQFVQITSVDSREIVPLTPTTALTVATDSQDVLSVKSATTAVIHPPSPRHSAASPTVVKSSNSNALTACSQSSCVASESSMTTTTTTSGHSFAHISFVTSPHQVLHNPSICGELTPRTKPATSGSDASSLPPAPTQISPYQSIPIISPFIFDATDILLITQEIDKSLVNRRVGTQHGSMSSINGSSPTGLSSSKSLLDLLNSPSPQQSNHSIVRVDRDVVDINGQYYYCASDTSIDTIALLASTSASSGDRHRHDDKNNSDSNAVKLSTLSNATAIEMDASNLSRGGCGFVVENHPCALPHQGLEDALDAASPDVAMQPTQAENITTHKPPHTTPGDPGQRSQQTPPTEHSSSGSSKPDNADVSASNVDITPFMSENALQNGMWADDITSTYSCSIALSSHRSDDDQSRLGELDGIDQINMTCTHHGDTIHETDRSEYSSASNDPQGEALSLAFLAEVICDEDYFDPAVVLSPAATTQYHAQDDAGSQTDSNELQCQSPNRSLAVSEYLATPSSSDHSTMLQTPQSFHSHEGRATPETAVLVPTEDHSHTPEDSRTPRSNTQAIDEDVKPSTPLIKRRVSTMFLAASSHQNDRRSISHRSSLLPSVTERQQTANMTIHPCANTTISTGISVETSNSPLGPIQEALISPSAGSTYSLSQSPGAAVGCINEIAIYSDHTDNDNDNDDGEDPYSITNISFDLYLAHPHETQQEVVPLDEWTGTPDNRESPVSPNGSFLSSHHNLSPQPFLTRTLFHGDYDDSDSDAGSDSTLRDLSAAYMDRSLVHSIQHQHQHGTDDPNDLSHVETDYDEFQSMRGDSLMHTSNMSHCSQNFSELCESLHGEESFWVGSTMADDLFTTCYLYADDSCEDVEMDMDMELPDNENVHFNHSTHSFIRRSILIASAPQSPASPAQSYCQQYFASELSMPRDLYDTSALLSGRHNCSTTASVADEFSPSIDGTTTCHRYMATPAPTLLPSGEAAYDATPDALLQTPPALRAYDTPQNKVKTGQSTPRIVCSPLMHVPIWVAGATAVDTHLDTHSPTLYDERHGLKPSPPPSPGVTVSGSASPSPTPEKQPMKQQSLLEQYIHDCLASPQAKGHITHRRRKRLASPLRNQSRHRQIPTQSSLPHNMEHLEHITTRKHGKKQQLASAATSAVRNYPNLFAAFTASTPPDLGLPSTRTRMQDTQTNSAIQRHITLFKTLFQPQ